MENELVNAKTNKACTSRIVMLLQHCIPDCVRGQIVRKLRKSSWGRKRLCIM